MVVVVVVVMPVVVFVVRGGGGGGGGGCPYIRASLIKGGFRFKLRITAMIFRRTAART